MVSGKSDGQPDTIGLTLGTSISASTEAGHKAVSLMVMPRKKVYKLSR